MAKELFRKEAMDRISSPEALDKLLSVTKPRQWLILVGLLCIISIGLVWAFTGEIVVRESVNAALVSSGGIDSVILKEGGALRDVRVQAGDEVRAGDIVARMECSDLVAQINETERNLGTDPSREELYKLGEMKSRLAESSMVVAEKPGRVVRVNGEAGDVLPPGFSLIEISVSGEQVKNLIGVLYVPLSKGRLVKMGMPVYIYPSVVKKEEFGYMLGRVYEVSEFTVDHSEIEQMIDSDELISYLTGNQAVLQILVDLQPDNDAFSGYAWSSSTGPEIQLESETLCSADIILGSKKPIEIVLPTLGRWL